MTTESVAVDGPEFSNVALSNVDGNVGEVLPEVAHVVEGPVVQLAQKRDEFAAGLCVFGGCDDLAFGRWWRAEGVADRIEDFCSGHRGPRVFVGLHEHELTVT